MSDFHETTIIGHLGDDPDGREVGRDGYVCRFPVAVNERWGDEDDDEKTTWYRVSAWDRLGENCEEFLYKGRQVHVIGTVEASAWIDDEDEPRATLELRARRVNFLSNGDNEDDRGGRRSRSSGSRSKSKRGRRDRNDDGDRRGERRSKSKSGGRSSRSSGSRAKSRSGGRSSRSSGSRAGGGRGRDRDRDRHSKWEVSRRSKRNSDEDEDEEDEYEEDDDDGQDVPF